MSQGVLALVGSGEFTDVMLEVDQFLLRQIKSPKVAILPTAAGQEKAFSKWIEDGVKHFKKLGIEVDGVNLINREDAQDPKTFKQLESFNFYYFSGGDPDYLLKVLIGSKIWDLIYKRFKKGEAILVGSSAGAMVFGKKVWAKVYDFDKKGILVPWEKGLGVVEFGVLPHFNMIRKYFNDEQIKKMESNYPKIKIVGIDEDTAYINMEGNWTVLGKGSIHEVV